MRCAIPTCGFQNSVRRPVACLCGVTVFVDEASEDRMAEDRGRRVGRSLLGWRERLQL
jgi:hypothetical protein